MKRQAPGTSEVSASSDDATSGASWKGPTIQSKALQATYAVRRTSGPKQQSQDKTIGIAEQSGTHGDVSSKDSIGLGQRARDHRDAVLQTVALGHAAALRLEPKNRLTRLSACLARVRGAHNKRMTETTFEDGSDSASGLDINQTTTKPQQKGTKATRRALTLLP
jgi:hypothetical protein